MNISAAPLCSVLDGKITSPRVDICKGMVTSHTGCGYLIQNAVLGTCERKCFNYSSDRFVQTMKRIYKKIN